MKTNRIQFLNTLQKVRPAVSTKNILDEMAYFLFDKNMIYAYNDKLCIGCKNELFDFSFSVPAEELLKILTNITDEDIELEYDSNKQNFQIIGNEVHVTLNTIKSNLILSIPDSSKNVWYSLPDNFIEGISLCIFSVSKDLSKTFLNCLNAHEKYIISSDNYRISRFELNKVMPISFLLPLNAAVELQTVSDIIQVSVNEGWIFFTTKEKNILFCSRLVEESYPDTGHLFVNSDSRKFELPIAIKKGIHLCDILSDKEFLDKQIELIFKGNKMICKEEGAKGSILYQIECDGIPENLIFNVNPIFLNNILNHATSVQILDNKLKFSCDSFEHIMALPEKK